MEDNYQIQTLVETKDFETLTAGERAIVLQQISADEYRARRNLLISTRAFFEQTQNQLKPDKSIQLTVAAKIGAQKQAQRRGVLQRLLAYQIPVAIPAMAFMLLFVALAVYYNNTQQQLLAARTKAPAQIVYKTKTVTVEKVVPRYVNVPVIKYVERSVATPVNTVSSKQLVAVTGLAEDAEQSSGGVA